MKNDGLLPLDPRGTKKTGGDRAGGRRVQARQLGYHGSNEQLVWLIRT
jgi:hypothetical protein